MNLKFLYLGRKYSENLKKNLLKTFPGQKKLYFKL